MLLRLLLTFCLMYNEKVNGLPSGAPLCVTKPRHANKLPQTSDPEICAGKKTEANGDIRITVSTEKPFKGIRILTSAAGSFEVSGDLRILECTGESDSLGPEFKAVTHSHPKEKTNVEAVFKKADNSQAEPEFDVIIVRHFDTFWTGIPVGDEDCGPGSTNPNPESASTTPHPTSTTDGTPNPTTDGTPNPTTSLPTSTTDGTPNPTTSLPTSTTDGTPNPTTSLPTSTTNGIPNPTTYPVTYTSKTPSDGRKHCQIHGQCSDGKICTNKHVCEHITCQNQETCASRSLLPGATKCGNTNGYRTCEPKECFENKYCEVNSHSSKYGKKYGCYHDRQCKPVFGDCTKTGCCVKKYKMKPGVAVCHNNQCFCRRDYIASCFQDGSPYGGSYGGHHGDDYSGHHQKKAKKRGKKIKKSRRKL